MPHASIHGIDVANCSSAVPGSKANQSPRLRTKSAVDTRKAMCLASSSVAMRTQPIPTRGSQTSAWSAQASYATESSSAVIGLEPREPEDHQDPRGENECVGVDGPGLDERTDPADSLGHAADAADHEVDAPVDPAPEEARRGEDGLHDQTIVELVHIPFVVEDLPEAGYRVGLGGGLHEPLRADDEGAGHDERSEQGGDQRPGELASPDGCLLEEAVVMLLPGERTGGDERLLPDDDGRVNDRVEPVVQPLAHRQRPAPAQERHPDLLR